MIFSKHIITSPYYPQGEIMTILKTISKKYANEKLKLLSKHDELYFGQILKLTGINPKNLSNLLKELEQEKLIIKTEKGKGDTQHLKKYYKLTQIGKQILQLLNKIEQLSNHKT